MQRSLIRHLPLVLLAATVLAVPALAQTTASATTTDLAEIDTAVAQFTGRSIGLPGGAAQPVDRRLRLARCVAPLAIGWRTGTAGERHDTVLVRCPDAGGWRLYVSLASAPPAANAPDATPVVQRGEAVTIAMIGDGFSVEQGGEALDPGPVGGWIRVRSAAAPGTGPAARTEARRARIVRPGLVEVPVE